MLKSSEGIYKDGRIELLEAPHDANNGTRVIVTFLESPRIDLREHGIDEEQAASIRAALATFKEDWESPEMDVYDDYDAAKTNR